MNTGERDELLVKLTLTRARDSGKSLFNTPINSVGFLGTEYGSLDQQINLRGISDDSLENLARSIGISKAPQGAKADVFINDQGVSLKSLAGAPPALVNHTSRPGFEFACNNVGSDIKELDSIIDEYWEKRKKGIIREDTKIIDSHCPFVSHKEYLRPILEYFMFDGTGSRLSMAKADYVVEFSNPLDLNSYRRLNKNDAFNNLWPTLIFSMRAKKGMPSGYTLNYSGPNADSIRKWVEFIDEDYRGALHIRCK